MYISKIFEWKIIKEDTLQKTKKLINKKVNIIPVIRCQIE